MKTQKSGNGSNAEETGELYTEAGLGLPEQCLLTRTHRHTLALCYQLRHIEKSL